MDQIDSTTNNQPQNPAETAKPAAPNWSSMALLSVNLSDLMREIILSGSVPQSF
jgi:hypothetical protein